MKLKSLILVGLLAFTSCSNQSQGFFIAKFYPSGPGCDAFLNVKEGITANGYLDVAAGAPQFFVGVDIQGGDNIVQQPLTVGNSTLERANRNQPLITQMVVTYHLSKKVGTAPKPYVVNASLPFSANGEVFGVFQLISPELGTQLFDGLTPPPGPPPSSVIEDFVDLLVDVEFKGEFSASKSPFTTGVLTLPIRAYRSLPLTCTNGYQRFPVDPMSGSIDPCFYTGAATLVNGVPQVTQIVQPLPPTCCPSVGAPGC